MISLMEPDIRDIGRPANDEKKRPPLAKSKFQETRRSLVFCCRQGVVQALIVRG